LHGIERDAHRALVIVRTDDDRAIDTLGGIKRPLQRLHAP